MATYTDEGAKVQALMDNLQAQVLKLEHRVLELERRAYGYDYESGEPTRPTPSRHNGNLTVA